MKYVITPTLEKNVEFYNTMMINIHIVFKTKKKLKFLQNPGINNKKINTLK